MSSCQTFYWIDFARYLDDGDRQENDKVAGECVREFSVLRIDNGD